MDCGATLSKTLLRVKTGPTADTPVTNEEVEQLTADLAQLMEAGGEDVAGRIISTIYGTDAVRLVFLSPPLLTPSRWRMSTRLIADFCLR